MNPFLDYAAPTSLEDAVRLLAGGDATLLAGGTDLMPQLQTRRRDFKPLLLSIRRIPELHGVVKTNGAIRVGALTTVVAIRHHPLLREHASILPQTADCFAGGQVRNRATLGGNICNASPAGDMIIPLLLLNTHLNLASWRDGSVATRTLPLCDFFVGPGQTRLTPDELLVSAEFAMPDRGFTAGFRKFGTRPALDISVVSVGIAGTKSNGVLKDARVAFGAVAPVPLRGRRTEAAVEGRPVDDEVMTAAAHAAAGEISPISDVRGSAWYRRELITVFVRRVLADVCR